MSDLHPIDRAAMKEIESGSETYAAWRRWCAANGFDAYVPWLNAQLLPIRHLERGLLKFEPNFSIEISSLSPRDVADIDFLVRHSIAARHQGDAAQPPTEVGPVRKCFGRIVARLRVAMLGLRFQHCLCPVEDEAHLLHSIGTVPEQGGECEEQGVLKHQQSRIHGVSHRFVSGFVRLIKARFGGRVE